VFPIVSAKVPIVKFQHLETQIEADISFYNTLAQENTKMLRLYSVIDERVKVWKILFSLSEISIILQSEIIFITIMILQFF